MGAPIASRPPMSHTLSAHLASAWESVDYAVTLVSPDARIAYANPACSDLYGYSTEELIGKPVGSLVRFLDQDDNTDDLPQLVQGRWQGESTGVTKDGTEFSVHVAVSEIQTNGSRTIGTVIVYRDISEEVNSREVLQASAEAQRRVADESAAIVKIGWIVNSSLNVNDVFDQFAAELRRLISFDRIVIWGVDSESRTATKMYMAGVRLSDDDVGETVTIPDDWYELLVKSRSAVATGDNSAPSASMPASPDAEAAGLISLIAVPLVSNDSVVATLFLMSKTIDAYSSQELGVARRVGMQIAGAITNSQLYVTVREEAEQRQVLAEIGRIITSSPKIEDVYDQFADEVRKQIRFDRFSIYVSNTEQTRVSCTYTTGVDLPEERVGVTAPVGSLISKVIERRATIQVKPESDVDVCENHFELIKSWQVGLRSFLAVPLISMNRAVGVIYFMSMTANEYTPADVALAERIADQVSGALANAQLYTEHLLTEVALRESEERYRMLVENANDAIVVIQGDRIAYHNVAWERMLGYGSEDIKDQNFYQYVLPADRDRMLDYYQKRLLEEEAPDEYEMTVVTADGRELMLEAKPRVVRFKHRRGVMLVMRDVTERKRLQEQLAQAQKMEAIGQLAGGVAHDFNNLLSVIMGFSQLADNARISRSDELPGHLAEIRKASERGARLTNQLLAFSRRQIIEPKVVDINQLIIGLDRMLNRLIRENIELVIHETKKDATVFVDPGQIEQVVVNLMVNARDAMPEGGELSISLDEPAAESDISELEDNDPGRYLIITVRDNGIGMSEEVQSRIFEPFFTTKEVGAGTGLGLSTCYGIAKQAGGLITVESQVGVGTTFRLYLPRVNASEATEDAPDVEEAVTTGVENILLVEDEPAVRTLIHAVLAQQGYQVADAGNGVEALEYARAHPDEPIDMLITDVVMPQMGGKKLAVELRKHYPGIKVLYVSGYPDANAGGSDTGPLDSGFIQKPFTIEAFTQKVRQTLDDST